MEAILLFQGSMVFSKLLIKVWDQFIFNYKEIILGVSQKMKFNLYLISKVVGIKDRLLITANYNKF